jgi:zinc transport system permease protein
MSEFFAALATQPFLQVALTGGLLASVACGVVGSYVVVRRISFLAGGIAHCVLGGIGAAVYLRETFGWYWLEPMFGAVLAALTAATLIGLISLRAKQWEDTVIGALWAVGMATGVLFVSATPGYAQDLVGYLFGNILLISRGDLWLIAVLDVVVLVVALGFYKQFLLVCFDEEYARARGLNVEAWYLLLLALTALTVVLLAWVVGIVLVIALLTVPVAIAGVLVRRLGGMMLVATLLTGCLVLAGFAASYQPNWPPGATIVVLAGGLYLLVMIARALLRRGRQS